MKYTLFFIKNLSLQYIKHSHLEKFLREQFITFSQNVSKKELETIVKYNLNNDQIIDAFCNRFSREIALDPVSLEVLLGCSKSERLRWTRERKLPVIYFKDVFKFGTHLMCPMYDRRIIGLTTTDELLKQWRKEWSIRRRKKHRVGKKSLIRLDSIFKDAFNLDLIRLRNQWYAKEEELGIVFELCYWLSILNYWIKDRIRRSTTSRVHYYEHKYAENIFLGYRNSIFKVLIQSKYCSFYLYKCKGNDRYTVQFCNKHSDYIFNKKLNEYIHPLEDFYIHPQKYKDCEDCKIFVREDYFSLYCIEVSSSWENILFTFFAKANLGKEIFTQEQLLNMKITTTKKYNEGMFINGRECIKNSSYIPDEKTTLYNLKNIYCTAKHFFKNKNDGFQSIT